MSAEVTFYNKMPFEIKMRKIWLLNSPPVRIPSGGTITGPYEILSQYTFLSPLHVDFSRVESIIQGSNYEYRDELLEPNKNITVITGPDGIPHEKSEKNVQEIEQTTKNIIEKTDLDDTKEASKDIEIDINNPPNWLSVKLEQLLKMAKDLNVDITHTQNMKPKDKKWELVKLVKAALKKHQDQQVQ